MVNTVSDFSTAPAGFARLNHLPRQSNAFRFDSFLLKLSNTAPIMHAVFPFFLALPLTATTFIVVLQAKCSSAQFFRKISQHFRNPDLLRAHLLTAAALQAGLR